MIVTAFGLAVIAVTGGSHTSALRHYSLAALIAVECRCLCARCLADPDLDA